MIMTQGAAEMSAAVRRLGEAMAMADAKTKERPSKPTPVARQDEMGAMLRTMVGPFGIFDFAERWAMAHLADNGMPAGWAKGEYPDLYATLATARREGWLIETGETNRLGGRLYRVKEATS